MRDTGDRRMTTFTIIIAKDTLPKRRRQAGNPGRPTGLPGRTGAPEATAKPLPVEWREDTGFSPVLRLDSGSDSVEQSS